MQAQLEELRRRLLSRRAERTRRARRCGRETPGERRACGGERDHRFGRGRLQALKEAGEATAELRVRDRI